MVIGLSGFHPFIATLLLIFITLPWVQLSASVEVRKAVEDEGSLRGEMPQFLNLLTVTVISQETTILPSAQFQLEGLHAFVARATW